MALFDWKAAIEAKAIEIESLLWVDKSAMFADGHGSERRQAEASKHSDFAMWLARSYNRKGIKRA